MRAILLTLAILCTGVRAWGDGRVLLEWDFTTASDNLGWQPGEPVDLFRIDGGVLVTAPGPGVPKMESPLFDIKADPWQRVEIEMKSDTGGSGLVYYSNTTEEPYHGFRAGQHASFEAVGDGQYHTYTVYPFWHGHSRIAHIRVDPPGKNVAIRAIRIMSYASGKPSTQREWDFRSGTCGWTRSVLASEQQSGGVLLTGDCTSVFFSPPLDMHALDNLWATIRVSTGRDRTILFRWASDKADGLQMLPVEVRGGRIARSYSLNLSATAAWTGRILVVGVTPTDASDSQEVLIEYLGVGSARLGPPEPRIVNLRTEKAFIRAGDNASLRCEVTNEGGATARQLMASARVTNNQKSARLVSQTISELAPGESRTLQWSIRAEQEGDTTAAVRLSGPDTHCDEQTVRVKVHRSLDPGPYKRIGYIPAPQPANTSDYLVGVYYYPGWRTYDRWAVLKNFPERRPVLGYYQEGNPEVADWHVKWALEHGISYFIYDWYWDRGTRHHEHAIHDGLFKSRYGDRIKFCLLWANHNPKGSHSPDDLEAVTKYWIENYFSRPNYLRIEGKNVVVMFSPHGLTSDMGTAAVKTSFDKMRMMCEDAGVGGLYLVACSYYGRDRIAPLEAEGYDAISGYNYPSAGNRGQRVAPYAWMVDGYNDIWREIAGSTHLPYIPVCEAGWDARPWHGMSSMVRTGKTPTLWQKMLENAKDFLDDPGHKKPRGQKLVFLEAWNEFGEGDYIEPHAEWGFDYLEAIRQTFAPSSRRPVLLTPRDLGTKTHELKDPGIKTSWDLSKIEDRAWLPGNMSEVSYERGTLRGKASNHDPIIYGPRVAINTSVLRKVEIRMRVTAGSEGQFFFSRNHPEMNEEGSVRFAVKGDGRFHTYVLDLSANPRWRGTPQALRLDPTDVNDAEIELAYVRFR